MKCSCGGKIEQVVGRQLYAGSDEHDRDIEHVRPSGVMQNTARRS
jgi:hypothetical protein